MATQVYVIPVECVEHFINDDDTFSDREKVKQIGTKCGEIYTLIDYEREINNGDLVISNDFTKEYVILID